jgi:hypothetical protein
MKEVTPITLIFVGWKLVWVENIVVHGVLWVGGRLRWFVTYWITYII